VVVVFAGDDRRCSAFTPTQSTLHHRHPAARPPANPGKCKHEHLSHLQLIGAVLVLTGLFVMFQ
jgi:hypothetical protein